MAESGSAARALRVGASRAIGVVVSDATRPFYAEVVRAADRVLSASGYALLIGSGYHESTTDERLVRLFEEQRVSGMLVNPVTAPPPLLAAVARRGMPVVMVDDAAPAGSGCSVTTDHFAGGRMAVSHLLGLGRPRPTSSRAGCRSAGCWPAGRRTSARMPSSRPMTSSPWGS